MRVILQMVTFVEMIRFLRDLFVCSFEFHQPSHMSIWGLPLERNCIGEDYTSRLRKIVTSNTTDSLFCW